MINHNTIVESAKEDVRLVNHVLEFLAMLRSSKSFLKPPNTTTRNFRGNYNCVCGNGMNERWIVLSECVLVCLSA